jgi:hypothetical protein
MVIPQPSWQADGPSALPGFGLMRRRGCRGGLPPKTRGARPVACPIGQRPAVNHGCSQANHEGVHLRHARSGRQARNIASRGLLRGCGASAITLARMQAACGLWRAVPPVVVDPLKRFHDDGALLLVEAGDALRIALDLDVPPDGEIFVGSRRDVIVRIKSVARSATAGSASAPSMVRPGSAFAGRANPPSRRVPAHRPRSTGRPCESRR